MPDIGGKRVSTKDMTDLGGMISEGWVRSYATVLVSLGNFVKGETEVDAQLPDVSSVSA